MWKAFWYKDMSDVKPYIQQAQYVEMEEGVVTLTPGPGLFPSALNH